MDDRLGRTVEVAGELEIAIGRDPRRAPPGGVEADGRQRPQRLALDLEALGDDEGAGRVPARQRDAVAPAGVDVVELLQRAETARRPEAGLVVAHRSLDRTLLARRGRRARRRVEGVMAAQLDEPGVPADLVALAPG